MSTRDDPICGSRSRRGFAGRLRGQTVAALTRRAKYLLAELSSGETLLMHLGMSGSFRIELRGGARSPARSSRSRRVRSRLGRACALQRSSPLRLHGRADRRRARAAPGPQPPRPGAAVGGFRRCGTGPCLPRQDDVAQSCPARSASRRRGRQHLRERGVARRGPVAATTSGNARDADGSSRATPRTGWPQPSSRS